MEYFATSLGQQSFHIRLSFTTVFTVSVKVELDINNLGVIGVATPPIFVSGVSDGELLVEVSRDGHEWLEVKRKPIRKGPISLVRLPLGEPAPAG
jgi:hypothetical protein